MAASVMLVIVSVVEPPVAIRLSTLLFVTCMVPPVTLTASLDVQPLKSAELLRRTLLSMMVAITLPRVSSAHPD